MLILSFFVVALIAIRMADSPSAVASPSSEAGPSSPPPAPPPPGPSTSPEIKVEPTPNKPEKKAISTTSDLWDQAEKQLSGEKGGDGETVSKGQEKTEAKKPDQPSKRFNSHEEAEGAFEKLTKEFEDFKKANEKPPKPEEGKEDKGGDGDEGSDQETELTEEELDVLWNEDPAAARKYERAQMEKKFQSLLEPFQEALDREAQERANRAESEALSSFKTTFEKENGEGSFEKVSTKIGEQKFLETVFSKNPTAAAAIRGLIKEGDRPGVFKILMQEAVKLEAKVKQEKSDRSIPPDTGSSSNGSSRGKDLTKKDVTMDDLWAEAERRNKK